MTSLLMEALEEVDDITSDLIGVVVCGGTNPWLKGVSGVIK